MSASEQPKRATDEQLRQSGFMPASRAFPRDEIALRLLCAFNGVDPKLAPPGWWFHPNGPSQDAWKRVADEAAAIYGQHVAALVDALRVIADLPLPQQDNQMSANMRIIARAALAKVQP